MARIRLELMIRAYKFLVVGCLAGAVFGFLQALWSIISNGYLSQGQENLTVQEIASSATRFTGYGLVAGAVTFGLAGLLIWLRNRLFLGYLDIKVGLKKAWGDISDQILVTALILGWVFFQLILSQPQRIEPRPLFLQVLLLTLTWLLGRRPFRRMLILLRALARIVNSAEWPRNALLLVLFIVASSNAGRLALGLRHRQNGPDVLIIVADALRAKSVSCYGAKMLSTPAIDEIASEGMLFENAMSNAPWTKPSVGSLFTSKIPQAHLAMDWPDTLKEKNVTMAERFKENNYRTYGGQTNPSLSPDFKFDQGFDRYDYLPLADSDEMISLFQLWLKKNERRPFFAYLHLMDTHFPYNAKEDIHQWFSLRRQDYPEGRGFATVDIRILDRLEKRERDRAFLYALYENAVRSVDRHVARIVDIIENRPSARETIILFTADHGEEFWEHANYAHGHCLYSEVVKVPLIIKYGSLGRGARVKEHIQLSSIQQILDGLLVAGRASEADKNRIFLDELKKLIQKKPAVYIEGILFGPEKTALIQDGWKIIRNSDQASPVNPPLLSELTGYVYPRFQLSYELYDLENDGQEKNNLIDQHPVMAGILKKRLNLLSNEKRRLSAASDRITKEKEEQLRSLGYIR